MTSMPPNPKIRSLDDLASEAHRLRGNNRRVVLCHGTFDLMHIGHVKYLQRSRQEGDALFVTLTSDRYVNRGPGRPVFNENLRAESLAALECVDGVAINDAATAVNIIEQLKPDVYAKGFEYRDPDDDPTGNITFEREAVESHGGRMYFADEIRFSSSSLLNHHFGVFPPQVAAYLETLRAKTSSDDLIAQLRALKNQKVLVVGEAIIDEYHYSSPMGQTGKSNTLAVKYLNREKFAGGAIAVANHIAGFVDSVTLATGLGSQHSQEDFIRAHLAPNVEPVFFRRDDAPTLVKRRYVDESLNKLFEVYFYNEVPMPAEVERTARQWLAGNASQYDSVIVPDFGNGFISLPMARTLSDQARYLAINTQLNSGNRGYHVVQRYPSANFISLNEPELRMAARNRHDPLLPLAQRVGNELSARHLAVTRGANGVLLCDLKNEVEHEVPALAINVVDRIGAGDAFLSLAGVCLGGGINPALAAFVGSAAAALDVQIVCNRESINPGSLFKYLTTLLK